MFKHIVKRLDVADLHNRMSEVLFISNGTMLATQALQVERDWARQAGDIFEGTEVTCSVVVDMAFFGNLARLVRSVYILRNDGFNDAADNDHEMAEPGDVDLDI